MSAAKTAVAIPQDIDAEKALLGAALADENVADRLARLVEPADFWKPAHAHIATAITKLTTEGAHVDPITVRSRLEREGLLDAIGGAGALVELSAMVAVGASPSGVEGYAETVRRHARSRCLIEVGGALASAGYNDRPDEAQQLLAAALARTDGVRSVASADPDLDEFLDSEDPAYDWLIEGLVERGDRVIITGPEGGGKSTLLRQVAVQGASGIHPFTLAPITPLRVLYVDTENSIRQARRAFRGLREVAGAEYMPGHLRVRVLGHSLDLADPAVQADLAARIDDQGTDLLVIGPLYKLMADDPLKEVPARAVADALDRLRAVHGSSVLIEAHSPYSEGAKAKRPIRPYGASLWSRWPEFGIYLDPDGGGLRHWRGPRDERSWPAKLQRATPWPWAPSKGGDEAPEWHGPTECADAIVALLLEAGAELSCNQIGVELRVRGRSFRDTIIRQAAALAHQRGDLTRRNGPRNALLYSTGPPKADDVLDF